MNQSLRMKFSQRFTDGIQGQSAWGMTSRSNDLDSFHDFTESEIAELKCFLDTYMPLTQENEQLDEENQDIINSISEKETVNDDINCDSDFVPVDYLGSKNAARPEKDLPKNDLSEELLFAFTEIAESNEFKLLNTYRKTNGFLR